MNKKERRIVLLTSIVHALVHMQMLIFAAVNVKMATEIGVSIETIGFIGTIGFLLFGFGALPAGFFIDKFGARKVLLASVSIMGIADIVVATASTPIQLVVGLALLGIGGSLYHPAGLGLISRNVEQKGHAMGIHGTIGNIGVASGPLIAGAIASICDWRWAYIWPIVPMIVMTFVYYNVRFEDKPQIANGSVKSPQNKFPQGMLTVMLLVIALQAMSGFIYRASNTFMPAYTGQKLGELFSGMDPTARGGLISGMILILGGLGQYTVGRLTRKYQMEWLQSVATAVVPILLFGFGILTGYPMLASAMGFAFAFYGLQPLGNGLVAKYSPPGVRGRSYGLSFSVSFGIGAFGSAFSGSVGQRMSYETIYLYLAAFAVVGALLAFGIYRLAKQRGFLEQN